MNLQKFIQNIPLDKLQHLAVGVFYSVFIPIFYLAFGFTGALIAFCLGTILNLYKEIYHDYYKKKGKLIII